MKLRDYILTYQEQGKIKANIIDYYEDFIKPLSPHFAHQSLATGLVICFFKDHADTDPSLGLMKDRFHKGVMLYHCFGCGKSGDVIRLHQIIQEQYHGVKLNEKEACLALADLFNIPIEEYEDLDEEDYEKAYMRTYRNLDKLARTYTVQDYNLALLELRKKQNVKLELVNREVIKLIAMTKGLVD